MAYEFFQVPSGDAGPEAERLNQFLNAHRIVKVEKNFFTDGTDGYWSFCVTWLQADSTLLSKDKRDTRVDYREVLDEKQFTVYSALRELRKEMAEKEGVPIYAVATNEQLAEMIKQNVDSISSLEKLPRFGKAKAERYGEAFLGLLRSRMGVTTPEPPPTK